jgi:hypothetical protein
MKQPGGIVKTFTLLLQICSVRQYGGLNFRKSINKDYQQQRKSVILRGTLALYTSAVTICTLLFNV